LKKELKRQMKQDDFASGLERGAAWLGAHWSEVRTTGIVLAVVVVGAAGLAYMQSERGRQAEQAFAEALDTFEAPVASELPEGFEQPAGPVYATAQEKYTKAVAAFDGLERRFGSHPLAVRARYFGALGRIELGQRAEAEKALTELAARGGGLEPALARLALADLNRRQGEIDKAIEGYRQLAGDEQASVPRDHALMSLARACEDARRLTEARASYRKLYEEFPESVYAGEARRRASFLESAG